jgi:threonylcarbamoyladenosine tRNA methylthiotransferase MtaB
MIKTFTTFAFGCRVNEAEKVVLDRKLTESGLIYNNDHPDYFIINSCAVTQKAEHEVRQFISQTRKKFPWTKIIVTGCAATNWRNQKISINEVDYIVENNKKNEIPSLINNIFCHSREGGNPEVKDDGSPTRLADSPRLRQVEAGAPAKRVRSGMTVANDTTDKFLNSGRLMIKIQDGCNRFCSYCIVPYLRGKPSTRKTQDIIDQINGYNDSVKEIILTAINTEYFGKVNQESLPQLLDAILTKTKVERISFGSIHPWSITDEFISWYKRNADNPRFVHFFHIPIQSGSDKILRLMNRAYTSNDILTKINLIQKINPLALIGTDIIVGFPGESDVDFKETYKFLEKSPISKFHIFRFSPRIGTKAAIMEKQLNKVNSNDKIARSHQLIELGKQKYQNFVEKLVGNTSKGLTLISKNNKQEIILENQFPIVLKDNHLNPGEIIQVLVSKSKNGEIYASII